MHDDAAPQRNTKAEVTPLGDAAVVVQLGDRIDFETHLAVRSLAEVLEEHPPQGTVECTSAFTTLTLFYDPMRTSFEEIRAALERIVSTLDVSSEMPYRPVEIPVCYGGEFGPDLKFVAEHCRLSPEEVVEIHASGEYRTYMIGFAPGFPYLGGMSQRIETPRRPSPRLRLPAGSVGIAGLQTGVYPIETPGGWQIIGRTPLALFRPAENPPSLLRVGDVVRFRLIDREQFDAWREADR
jgi:inhibitor of KinA